MPPFVSTSRFALASSLIRVMGLVVLCILVVQPVGAQRTAADDAPVARVGEPAPNFTLTAADGSTHTLGDYRGRIVVLQWTNRRCPYCQRLYDGGLIQRAFRQVRKLDQNVVWLAINSTFDTTINENTGLIEQYKLKMPVLVDADGTVARQYDARMTPQSFVINADGVLVYSGAFDNDPNGRKADRDIDVTNHVVEAVRATGQGQEVKPDTTRPYGCRIKFNK